MLPLLIVSCLGCFVGLILGLLGGFLDWLNLFCLFLIVPVLVAMWATWPSGRGR